MNKHEVRVALALAFGAAGSACGALLGIPEEGSLVPASSDAAAADHPARDAVAEPDAVLDAEPDAGLDAWLDAARDADADCGDKLIDPLNCGVCNHSCLNGGCDAGTCLPYALVKDMEEFGVVHLALTGNTLLAYHDENSTLLAVDGVTGTVSNLVRDVYSVNEIATDGAYAYWTGGGGSSGPASLQRCSLAGCPDGGEVLVNRFAAFFPGVVHAGGRLYFRAHELDAGSFDTVESVAIDGTQRKTVASRRPYEKIGAVASDGVHVYWGEENTLVRAPIAGLASTESPERVGGTGCPFGGCDVTAIALDAQRVVWADVGDEIFALPLAAIGTSQQPAVLARSQLNVRTIQIHRGYLYWAAAGYLQRPSTFIGAVRRCRLPACASIETIADPVRRGFTVAVNDLAIYFSEAGNDEHQTRGSIWRLAQ